MVIRGTANSDLQLWRFLLGVDMEKKKYPVFAKSLKVVKSCSVKAEELQQCVKTKSLHAVTRSGVSQY